MRSGVSGTQPQNSTSMIDQEYQGNTKTLVYSHNNTFGNIDSPGQGMHSKNSSFASNKSRSKKKKLRNENPGYCGSAGGGSCSII